MSLRLRRSAGPALLAGLSVLGAAVPAAAAGADRYIVQLADSPLASYAGGTRGIPATSPKVTGGEALELSSRAARRYRSYLADRQAAILDRLGARAPDAVASYRTAFAGFAAELTTAQVAELRDSSLVARVTRDGLRRPTQAPGRDEDDALGGPSGDGAAYLGLPRGLWRRLGGAGQAGAGVVVGVIDTGIVPEHPSFADDPASGYRGAPFSAPAGWSGACEAGERFSVTDCNGKLIGARYFVEGFGLDKLDPASFVSPRDDDGHGSHTASTAAGNFGVDPVIAGNDLGVDEISGIAPRAHVAAYKACWTGTEVSGCSESDLVAAIDAAVRDGVDVINYSIGSSTPSVVGPDAVAFLGAADAGVFVATSAGNDGPNAGTLGSPSTVPWVTSVAASTLARTFAGTATVTPDGGEAPFTVTGASVTNALTPVAPIVDAVASAAPGAEPADAELCRPGSLDPAAIRGRAVLCLRGGNARVNKGDVVRAAGGVGMLLYNASDAQEIVTDNHFVPTLHLSFSDGQRVKAAIGPGTTVELGAGGTAALRRGGVLAAFSSRGPQLAVPDIAKPDVTAPGVNVLAAAAPEPAPGTGLKAGETFQSISGTSMSSPHVAGAAALLRQLRPGLTPDGLKSALMTTAYPDVLREDGDTEADPFDTGSGEIDPNLAADPGLVLEVGTRDQLGYLEGQIPGILEGIGPVRATDLNLPSVSASKVAGALDTRRTFTSVDGATRRWNVSVEGLAGITASPSTRRFTIAPGARQSIDLRFTVTTAPIDRYAFGALVLRSGARTVRLPISLRPTAIAAPGTVAVRTPEAAGTTPLFVHAGFRGTLSALGWGLAPPEVRRDERIGTTTGLPKLMGPDAGTRLYTVTVPEDAQLVAGRIANTDAGYPETDLDLYVFHDEDEDGAFGLDELVALSADSDSDEAAGVPLPAPGRYGFAVVGYATRTPESVYDFTTWLVADPRPDDPAPAPGLAVTGDPAAVIPGQAVPLTLEWSAIEAPGTHLGVATYHDAADPTPENGRGFSLVEIERTAGGTTQSVRPTAFATRRPPAGAALAKAKRKED